MNNKRPTPDELAHAQAVADAVCVRQGDGMSKTGKRDTDISEFFTAPADNVRRRPMSKLSADTGNDYPSAHAGLQDALDAATANRVGGGIRCVERKACDPPEIYPNKKGLSLPAGVDALVSVHQSSTLAEVLRALAVSSYNAGVCASGGHTSPLIPLLVKDALLRADELAAATNGDRK